MGVGGGAVSSKMSTRFVKFAVFRHTEPARGGAGDISAHLPFTD